MIERKCVDDVAFRWLTAGACPGLSGDRRIPQAAPVCARTPVRAGVGAVPGRGRVRLGRVALDRTRVRDNVLVQEVSALLTGAERIDEAEDAAFGKNRRVGAAEQLRRRDTGLAKIWTAWTDRAGQESAVRGHRKIDGAAASGRRAVAGVGVRGRIRRRDAQDAHALRRRLTDDGVDDEVAGDRRGAGKRLHRRRPRRAVSGRRSAGPSVRHHRAATRPAVAGVGGRRAEQAGVDDGLDGRRGPQAAVDTRRRPRRGISFQPSAIGRHGAVAGQREEGAYRRRRCGQRPAVGGAECGPVASGSRCAARARRQSCARRRRRRSPRA